MQVTRALTKESLKKNPSIVSGAEAFLQFNRIAQPHDDFSDGIPYLYVGQGEMAYSFTSHPLALVSDDATTCCIITLSNPTCFVFAHVDSPKQVYYLFKHWESSKTLTSTTNVHVVGGYQDEDHTGETIVASLIEAMKQSNATYIIQLWVTDELNTIPSSVESPHTQPKARGAICVPISNSLSISSIDFARDTYRGPLFIQRMISVSRSTLSLLKEEAELVVTLGPYERCAIPIKHHEISKYKWWVHEASDEMILSSCSTSPFAEGPKFVSDIRARFQAAIDLIGKEEIFNQCQNFHYNKESKSWIPSM